MIWTASWSGSTGRPIRSIFIGGGTPSLFDGEWIARLLGGIGDRLTLSGDAEITLESNPNSADAGHFKRYRRAGINRLSIGVQTFHDHALQSLGRLHSGDEARHALDHIPAAGFDRWNVDLMHGLPGQNATMAEADVAEAIERSAGHISWYQLTIERNTRFWSAPPTLPNEDELECIQSRGEGMFQTAGFLQYEVSAYSRKGEESRHNLNYWQFGDYVGLGCWRPWQSDATGWRYCANTPYPPAQRLPQAQSASRHGTARDDNNLATSCHR